MGGEISRGKLGVAFGAVYLIWGSTYMAIRVGVEAVPPLLLLAVRCVLAGAILWAWAWARGQGRVRARYWWPAFVAGGLLFLVGHGGLFWAEQRVPSGVASLFVSTLPASVVLLEWLRPGGSRPAPRLLAGVLLGFGGVVLLLGPGGTGGVDPLGATALLAGTFAWGLGATYYRGDRRPPSPLLATALQLLTGGALLLAVSWAAGEPARVDLRLVPPSAFAALVYLVVFGSLVAFTAFTWLMDVTSPTMVSSYAYVNPVVALGLGALAGGEELTPRMVVAAAVILSGVVLIVLGKPSTRPAVRLIPAFQRIFVSRGDQRCCLAEGRDAQPSLPSIPVVRRPPHLSAPLPGRSESRVRQRVPLACPAHAPFSA